MKELKSIKLARVVATIFILICHVIKYYTFVPGSAQLGQFFNVGVPMFLIISGYLYGIKANLRDNKVTKELRSFFVGRIIRVALPCQIWAIVLFVVTLFAYPLNTLVTVLNMQGLGWILPKVGLLEGSPWLSHTWFVTIILLCYCLVPWLRNHYQIFSLLSLGVLYLICIGLLFIEINLTYFVLFMISYILGAIKFDVSKISNLICVMLISISLAIRLLGHHYFDSTVLYNGVIVITTHHLIAASIIVIIANIVKKRTLVKKIVDSKITTFVDKHSYSIYIVHYAVIEVIYSNTNIVVASVLFIFSTIILAVILDGIGNYCMQFMQVNHKNN